MSLHRAEWQPSQRFFGMAMAVVMAAACGADARAPLAPSSPSPSTTVLPGVGSCRVTLTAYCGARGCPSYATAVENLRRGCAAGEVRRGLAGHCPGVFYYTSNSGDFVSIVSYFDGDGKMIGARTATDFAQYCNGTSFTLEGGEIPTCPRPLELEPLC